MLACFITNRPKKLSDAITAYKKQLEGHELLVIDTDATHSENASLLPKGALHYSETELPELLPDYARAFTGKYGGARNQALAIAAWKKSAFAFFDDDTRPVNDVMRRHENALAKGYEIVCGKYVGHSGGVPNLIIQLINTLQMSGEGKNNELKRIFSGVPKRTGQVIVGAGLNGGNLGISLKAAESYAFYPTSYRVEDGTYGALSPYYLGDKAVYDPQTKVETESYSPVVEHEMAPGKPNALMKKLVNEIQGISLGLGINALLSQKMEVNKENVIAQRVQSNEIAFKEYLVQYIQETAKAKNLEDKMNETGLKDEANEFKALLALELKDTLLTEEEYAESGLLFFETQKNWKAAITEAKKKLVG
jgi:hypothetical protein